MSITQLFEINSAQQVSTNARSLTGTAQLTSHSMDIAKVIMTTVEKHFVDYQELVAKSKVDHNAMDELVLKGFPLFTEDIGYLRKLPDETLENMLKSQQSKRSRSKSKVMTMENYKTMMVGAIAENLIRIALGKMKSAAGTSRVSGTVEFSQDILDELEEDQERLRKEIRNVQSKKSIMKSKADFSETDERWLSLLKAEEQLKAIRIGANTTVVEVDTTREKIAELLVGVNLETIRTFDGRELLEKIKRIIINAENAIDDNDDDEVSDDVQ